jgi:alanine racemase
MRIDKLGSKWVEINLDVLERNLRQIQKRIAPAGLIAVVKADAYGHGAVEVARCAEKIGVRFFAVSCLEEAIELRRSFVNREILIFGAPPENQVCDILTYDLTPTVCSLEFAKALSREAVRLGKEVRVHVCVDTGDGRVGPFYSQAAHFIRKVASLRKLKLTGLYSHFSTADEDFGFAAAQQGRFESLLSELRESGLHVPMIHLANSAGILNVKGSAYTHVRPGLMLYGIYPCERKKNYPAVESVFSLKTRVTFVKTVPKGFTVSYGRRYVTEDVTDIVTLPVGYADGFPRKFSNAGEVLIRKKRYPVVGAVCMDMIMVDAGRGSGVRVGDEAVLIGRQGREEISVYEIARRLGTIPYEVICNIGKRVTRVYLKEGRVFEVKRMISEF